MKKFLFATLTVLTAITVFAEPYSKQKYKSFNGVAVDERKYCYQAQISNETDFFHMFQYFGYLIEDMQKNLTKQEFKQFAKKFEGKISKNTCIDIIGQYAAQIGNEEFALQCFEICKSRFIYNRLYNFYKKTNNVEKIDKLMANDKVDNIVKISIAKDKKDYSAQWQLSKKVLLKTGGFEEIKTAQRILTQMFKYRPRTITKEEQVEFLEQIAQIYPIPGTDFNQWKNFMGFLGFKYKQLTKKQLF